MHAVYWIVTHPVNQFWLKDQQLQGAASGFFSFDLKRRGGPQGPNAWESARDRWDPPMSCAPSSASLP